MIIGVFGDSIAWGKADNKQGGWSSLLRNFVESNNIAELYNLSIDGDTSKGLVQRFENEYKIRNIDSFIFAIGINDSIYRKDFSNVETSKSSFEETIMAIIKLARKKIK